MNRIFCIKAILIGALLGLTGSCLAKEERHLKAADEAGSAKVISSLKKTFPQLQIKSVQDTPINGVEEIILGDGQSIYAINGSEYFLKGDLFKASSEGLVNITEERKKDFRLDMLKPIKPENMIVYSPKGEKKGEITIFTDTDCGYCQKLHNEVPALNSMGIEVRYLAFPRGGLSSSTYNDFSSAWCASDKQEALNKLKSRQKIPSKTCNENPVTDQYDLGIAVGVTATPAIMLPDGTLLLGYRTASDLKKLLGV